MIGTHFISKRGFCICAETETSWVRSWWNNRLRLKVLFTYYHPLRYYTCINISRIFHPGRNSYLRVDGYLNWLREREQGGRKWLQRPLNTPFAPLVRLLFKGLLCQLNPLHIRRVQVLAADAKVILESPSCRFFCAHPLVAAPFLSPYFCLDRIHL